MRPRLSPRLGFQLTHKATCQRRRVSDAPLPLCARPAGWAHHLALQCTTCRAVFTVLPHFVLRYRPMRPEVARDALLATHGGRSLELCAVICHISPMALYRLVCAFGHQSSWRADAVWAASAGLFPGG